MLNIITRSLCLILLTGAIIVGAFFTGYSQIHYAPAVLCVVAVAILLITPQFFYGIKVPVAIPAILIFLFWLYVTASIMWSSVPYVSLMTYIVFVCAPLCFFSFVSSFDVKWMRVLQYTLLGVMLLAGLYAIIQSTLFGGQADKPFLSANTMAGFLALGLFPALGYYLGNSHKNIVRALFLGLYLVILSGLVCTQSRGAFLILLPCMATFLILLYNATEDVKRKYITALTLSVAVVIATDYAIDFGMVGRLAAIANPEANSPFLSRLAVWTNTLPYIKEHGLFGTGFGTFYLYYSSYRLPGLDVSSGQWAHMDPLQFWAELGIIAPVLFYTLCISIISRFVKLYKSGQTEHLHSAAGIFIALLFIIAHTHISFHLYILPILIVIGLYIAQLYTFTDIDGKSFKTFSLPMKERVLPLLSWIAVSCLLIAMVCSTAWGIHNLNLAHRSIKKNKPGEFIQYITRAKQYAPKSFIEPDLNLTSLYLDLSVTTDNGIIGANEKGLMQESIVTYLDEAEKFNPVWAEINYKRGLYYSTQDSNDRAITEWSIALKKDPTHFRARESLASAYIKAGQVSLAYDTLNDGLGYPLPQVLKEQYKESMKTMEALVRTQRHFRLKNDRKKNAAQSQAN